LRKQIPTKQSKEQFHKDSDPTAKLVSTNRLCTHERVYGELAEKFTRKVKEMTELGNGLAEV
jgi:hypothetical protein